MEGAVKICAAPLRACVGLLLLNLHAVCARTLGRCRECRKFLVSTIDGLGQDSVVLLRLWRVGVECRWLVDVEIGLRLRWSSGRVGLPLLLFAVVLRLLGPSLWRTHLLPLLEPQTTG